MKALAQCWFTRAHAPAGRPVREDDGTHHAYCRHCERAILSWDHKRWFLASGFNVTRLAETVGGRFVVVLDSTDEFVVARHSLADLPDEAAIAAFKDELAERLGVGRPGSTLELIDSGAASAPARAARSNKRAGPARLSASF